MMIANNFSDENVLVFTVCHAFKFIAVVTVGMTKDRGRFQ